MTQLQTYLAVFEGGQGDFAKSIETSQAHVSAIASGKKLPSLKLAIKIEQATGGKVPASSWSPAPKSEAA